MSRRNLIWLAVILVVGAVVWIAAGWAWGLIAAAGVLVASELTERTRRRRRAKETGQPVASPLKNVAKRRKR